MVARGLEVTGGACEDHKGAIGMLCDLGEGYVFAACKVVLLEAPLVVGVQGGAQLLVEGHQEECNQQRPRGEVLPSVAGVAHDPLLVERDGPKDAELHAGHQQHQEQHGTRDDDGVDEEFGTENGHDADSEHEKDEPDREELVDDAHVEEGRHKLKAQLFVAVLARGANGARHRGEVGRRSWVSVEAEDRVLVPHLVRPDGGRVDVCAFQAALPRGGVADVGGASFHSARIVVGRRLDVGNQVEEGDEQNHGHRQTNEASIGRVTNQVTCRCFGPLLLPVHELAAWEQFGHKEDHN
mmetsp:Transcript_7204/g.17027  ORF Transcript_7204/g.17027 Transcript_7204/m.17027 type:complete len:296 (-) Transcript_7204:284-1171(-)